MEQGLAHQCLVLILLFLCHWYILEFADIHALP